MHRHVCWYCPDDIWGSDELDADGWSQRHIEARGADGTILAAASQAEVIAARDSGAIDAVRANERTYGVAPEGPMPIEPLPRSLQVIGAEEFESLWRKARRHLAP